MNPKLIKANIALFSGDRAETQRLLNEYRQESAAHDPQVLWLNAHAQINHDECLRLLHELIATTDPDNKYARMARHTLLIEEEYQEKLQTSTLPRLTAARVLPVVLVFIVIIALIVFRQPAPETDITATQEVAIAPTATTPIDQSEALVADGFSVRYDAGILQIAAFEDQSLRVVDRDGNPVQPVLGARFYALRLIFECRAGICSAPPEADLALQMDNGNVLTVRDDLRIVSEEQLQPVALGRVTRGWIVFEVPVVSAIQSLVVAPRSGTNATPVIQTIDLPG